MQDGLLLLIQARTKSASTIMSEIDTLADEFSGIANRTFDICSHFSEDIEGKRRFINHLRSLPLRSKLKHQKFLNNYIKSDEPFVDIWGECSQYWNFWNCSLLGLVIAKFGNDNLKCEFDKYKERLQEFLGSTLLKDFMQVYQELQVHPKNSMMLNSKLEAVAFDDCTLLQVEKKRNRISQIVFLPEHFFKFIDATPGCTSIVWAIPASLTLSPEEVERANELGKEEGIQLSLSTEYSLQSDLDGEYCNVLFREDKKGGVQDNEPDNEHRGICDEPADKEKESECLEVEFSEISLEDNEKKEIRKAKEKEEVHDLSVRRDTGSELQCSDDNPSLKGFDYKRKIKLVVVGTAKDEKESDSDFLYGDPSLEGLDQLAVCKVKKELTELPLEAMKRKDQFEARKDQFEARKDQFEARKDQFEASKVRDLTFVEEYSDKNPLDVTDKYSLVCIGPSHTRNFRDQSHGKWHIFRNFEDLNDTWRVIREKTISGELGATGAICSTLFYNPLLTGPGPQTVGRISVLTKEENKLDVGYKLIQFPEVQHDIGYKTQEDTVAGVYAHKGNSKDRVTKLHIYWNKGNPSTTLAGKKKYAKFRKKHDQYDVWKLNIVEGLDRYKSLPPYSKWIVISNDDRGPRNDSITNLWHTLKREVKSGNIPARMMECPAAKKKGDPPEIHVYSSEEYMEEVGQKLVLLCEMNIARIDKSKILYWNHGKPSYDQLSSKDNNHNLVGKVESTHQMQELAYKSHGALTVPPLVVSEGDQAMQQPTNEPSKPSKPSILVLTSSQETLTN